MYPVELEIKDATESNAFASYNFIYHKRNDFNSEITNIPFPISITPSSQAYDSWLYTKCSGLLLCFIIKVKRLWNKLN